MSIDYAQIESSQKQHDQYLKHMEEMYGLREERVLKCIAILKPKSSKDGNMFCFLLGENLQEGIAGFGDTCYLAADQFYENYMNEKITEVNQ